MKLRTSLAWVILIGVGVSACASSTEPVGLYQYCNGVFSCAEGVCDEGLCRKNPGDCYRDSQCLSQQCLPSGKCVALADSSCVITEPKSCVSGYFCNSQTLRCMSMSTPLEQRVCGLDTDCAPSRCDVGTHRCELSDANVFDSMADAVSDGFSLTDGMRTD